MANLPAADDPRRLSDILAETTFRTDSVEVVFTDKRRVVCDGPGGALGHPRVYYTIGDKGFAECGYCDRLFVLDPARAGERLEGPFEPDSLPTDGISERATPPPRETLASDGDTGA